MEARLEYRTYQDDEGKDRGAVAIIAADVQFLDKPAGGEGEPRPARASGREDADPEDIPF